MPVQLVNMIPRSLSDEQEQDSEPSLTVNPANPQEIVGTAFTPDPAGGSAAPLYFSTDGGNTWLLNFIVPSKTITSDITVAFGGAKSYLYAGIIRLPQPAPNQIRLNVLRTTDFRSATMMKVLDDRNGVDQPFVHGSASTGRDRLFVGGNDFAVNNGRTATVDRYLNASAQRPRRQSIRVEVRDTDTAGQDGPAIRSATHSNGVAYAVFYSWRSFQEATNRVTTDVVVVRDDPGTGSSTAPFTMLKDQVDGKAGQRVAGGVTFIWNAKLGQQRLGGDLAIAVDPTNSNVVYVAWAGDGPSGYTVTVQRSTDGGQTWSTPIRTLVNTVNPSLAVNSQGTLGLLSQQVQGSGINARWVTQIETTADGGATWQSVVLATVPATTPAPQFQPYIGDYVGLVAVARDFYGIFSANNTPDMANFPNGVRYQRNADFTQKRLIGSDGVRTVPISIDPFFFKLTGS